MKLRALQLFAGAALAASALRAQDEADRRPGFATDQMLQVDTGQHPPTLIPAPAEVYWGQGSLNLGNPGTCACTAEVVGAAADLAALPEEFAKRVQRSFGAPPVGGPGALRLIFTLSPGPGAAGSERAATLAPLDPEAYILETTVDGQGPCVLITGKSPAALWHGMVTAAGLIERRGDRCVFPRLRIVDYPKMQDRGLLVDIGGQGYMVGPARWDFERWKAFVDWMVDCKLNDLWIEIIGSGRLMGNLDMSAGEWVGFPLDLRSYPQLVGRDRPIRRWDETQQRVVNDRYTIPNVRQDFTRELIDYAQARGVRCELAIGWDYFANQLPVTLGIPANNPEDPRSDRFYDTVLKEVVKRYDNASGVVLITIENKDVPSTMLSAVIGRARVAEKIVHAANPRMRLALLADYLEWRPPGEIETLRRELPPGMALAYTPHREPQQRAWARVYGDVWRYQLYSQYAWDHVAYVFPDQVRRETLESYSDGYRRVVSQAWYFDVFALNYLALAEYAWNPTGSTTDQFWDKVLDREFGRPARNAMREALEHTRFDLRFDIIARMIARPDVAAPFSFWDMYRLTHFDGLTDGMLAGLESDARASLAAARTAAPLARPSARELVAVTEISAERRLYLATSARHLLRALALKRGGDVAGARREMALCVADGEKMETAAHGLGIEYPMAVHDEKVVERYRAIQAGL